MKTRNKIALCAVALLALNACKKEDDGNSNPNTSASIVGEWEATRFKQKNTLLSTNPPSVVSNKDSTFTSGNGYYIRFDANNAYLSKMTPAASKGYDSGTYSFITNNTRLVYYSQVLNHRDTFDIAVTNNSFTMTRNDTIAGYYTEYYMALKRL